MASARTSTPRVGVRTRARTPVIQEIVPNSGWTEDSAGHYLLVDLPGIALMINIFFKKILEYAYELRRIIKPHKPKILGLLLGFLIRNSRAVSGSKQSNLDWMVLILLMFFICF